MKKTLTLLIVLGLLLTNCKNPTEVVPNPCNGYTLSVSTKPTNGGTVSITGTHCYNPGTTVNVMATQNFGYIFTGWSGTLTSEDKTITVIMNSDITLIANFEYIGGFKDLRDNKIYRAVRISGKVWMSENLNYETDNSWCYGDNPANCLTYGRLYTWDVAMTACPADWRLPTREDWDNLVSVAGGSSAAGGNLKSTSGWIIYSGVFSTNRHGFSALPGGYRWNDGIFTGIDNTGFWWNATEYSSDGAYYRAASNRDNRMDENYYPKDYGFSVRCIQDI